MPAVAGDIDVTALLRGDVYGPGHRDAEVARWFAANDDAAAQGHHIGMHVATDLDVFVRHVQLSDEIVTYQ